MSSPTARSLALLRADGWYAEVTEQNVRIPGRTFKRDLFGFVDILALRGPDILAVQTTSAANVAARMTKIADSPLVAAVRSAGIQIHVHGWRRGRDGKWVVRVEDLS